MKTINLYVWRDHASAWQHYVATELIRIPPQHVSFAVDGKEKQALLKDVRVSAADKPIVPWLPAFRPQTDGAWFD